MTNHIFSSHCGNPAYIHKKPNIQYKPSNVASDLSLRYCQEIVTKLKVYWYFVTYLAGYQSQVDYCLLREEI